MEPQHFTPSPTVMPPPAPKKTHSVLGMAPLIAVMLVCFLLGGFALQNHQELKRVKSDLNTTKQSLATLQSKKTEADEFEKVDASRYQAIFLSSDKVYFGKITQITPDFYKIIDIYYLQNGSATVTRENVNQGGLGNVSLVKLGCELHKPTDEMVVNRQQTEFWENLTPDGAVSKAIKNFEKQNPNGQKCA